MLTHFRMPTWLNRCISDFSSNGSIYMSFKGEDELPVPFPSGLVQRSPLSPVLYILYASGLFNQALLTNEGSTAYIDEEGMIQGSRSQKFS